MAPVRQQYRVPPSPDQQPTSDVARWTLQTRGEVTMETPVVRLRDVAMLIGPDDPQWDRIGGSAIALLPTDGRRLSIERQRLADVLARHLAGQRTVQWVGPDLTSIRFAPQETALSKSQAEGPAAAAEPVGDPLQQTGSSQQIGPSQQIGSSQQIEPSRQIDALQQDVQATQLAARATPAPLAAATAERLIRLVHYAVDRADPTARDQYDVQIDPRSPALTALADARSVRLLRAPGALQPGPAVLIVQGDLPGGEVSAQLPVTFQPRPLAVFSTQSIRRGDRISPQDVELRPLGRGQSADGTISDLQAAIGMEARNALHSGRPISNGDIGLPIIIRRGDLVEVRVVGRSVTVRTSARALDDSSEGELLQVETQTPRRRLMARAVTPGVVEIITRPPQIGR